MKLLFITGLTGYGLGGARAEAIRLVRGVAEHGFEAALAIDNLPDSLVGVRQFSLVYPDAPQRDAQISHAVAEFRPDLVHVIGGGIRLLWTCEKILAHLPWIFTAHNVPPAEKIFHHWFAHSRLHFAARNVLALPSTLSWMRLLRRERFDNVICHSDVVLRRLLKGGCPAAKASKIVFGTEPTPPADPAKPSPFPADAFPKILTVAGLAPHKGQLDAVNVAARLLPQFPKLAYRFIGGAREPRYAEFVAAAIRAAGLEKHASILDRATDATKFAALRDADLYLQPSYEEGFCMAFLEASMIVPRLIGTDTGEIAAIAGADPTAATVRPGDIAAMEAAARRLLDTRPTAEMLRRRLQSLQEQYDWSNYLQKHLRIYHAIFGGALPDSARDEVATAPGEHRGFRHPHADERSVIR